MPIAIRGAFRDANANHSRYLCRSERRGHVYGPKEALMKLGQGHSTIALSSCCAFDRLHADSGARAARRRNCSDLICPFMKWVWISIHQDLPHADLPLLHRDCLNATKAVASMCVSRCGHSDLARDPLLALRCRSSQERWRKAAGEWIREGKPGMLSPWLFDAQTT